MQPPQALANGASQGPKHSADEQNNPSAYVFSLTLLPTAKRFSPTGFFRRKTGLLFSIIYIMRHLCVRAI
jgi:hypothetical protein